MAAAAVAPSPSGAGKVFASVGHFFASIFHGVVKAEKAVVADASVVAVAVDKAQPVVNLAVSSLFGPAATTIENLAYQVFGNVVATINTGGQAINENGALNLQLDSQLISQIKSLGVQGEQLAAAIGVSKPTNLPVTAPKS